MAVIIVRIGEGRPIEIKRRLAAQITAAAVDVLEETPGTITVLIEEIARDNWATGGVLQSERSSTPGDQARQDVESFFRKPPPAKAPPRKAAAKPQRRR